MTLQCSAPKAVMVGCASPVVMRRFRSTILIQLENHTCEPWVSCHHSSILDLPAPEYELQCCPDPVSHAHVGGCGCLRASSVVALPSRNPTCDERPTARPKSSTYVSVPCAAYNNANQRQLKRGVCAESSSGLAPRAGHCLRESTFHLWRRLCAPCSVVPRNSFPVQSPLQLVSVTFCCTSCWCHLALLRHIVDDSHEIFPHHTLHL